MRIRFPGNWRGLVFGCVACVAGVQVAHAATMRNAPGAYCSAAGGGSLTIGPNGAAENRSSSTVTAICPVERDPSVTTVSAEVAVVDQHATGNVCCRLVDKNPTGSDNPPGSAVCSTGSSTTYQLLTLPARTASGSYSHFYVSCTVPAIQGTAVSHIEYYRTAQ